MVRDEVAPVLSGVSYEPLGGGGHDRQHKAGHDRHDKAESRHGENNGNIFAGILGFFAGFGKNKDGRSNSSASETRADTSSTPLTARDSDPGEDCCELHDNDPAPLEPRWNVYPPGKGEGERQQRRRTSQPVAIKRPHGTRASTGRKQRPTEPVESQQDFQEPDAEGAGQEGKPADCGGEDADAKIKAWQRRRMATKRGSFTVRRRRGAHDRHSTGRLREIDCRKRHRQQRKERRAHHDFSFLDYKKYSTRCRGRVKRGWGIHEKSSRRGVMAWLSRFRCGIRETRWWRAQAPKLNFGAEFPSDPNQLWLGSTCKNVVVIWYYSKWGGGDFDMSTVSSRQVAPRRRVSPPSRLPQVFVRACFSRSACRTSYVHERWRIHCLVSECVFAFSSPATPGPQKISLVDPTCLVWVEAEFESSWRTKSSVVPCARTE